MKNLALKLLLAGLVGPSLAFQTGTPVRSPAANPHAAQAAVSSDAEKEAERRLLSNARQLTFQGRRAGEGYFSADGTKLIFQAEREPQNPFFQIYVMDLEDGGVQRVSPGHGKTTCGWIHPGGAKVLFASTHEDEEAVAKQKEELERRASGNNRRYSWDYDENYEIYQGDLTGNQLHNLTGTLGYDAEASWSPDGSLIVFSSNRHGYKEGLSDGDQAKFKEDKSYLAELYLMDAQGGHVQRLTHSKGYDGGPFFGPSGAQICWRRFSEDGATAEIYTMNLKERQERQITRLGAMSWAPYFHPSGDYLIFATNLHGFGNFELYLVDVQGKGTPARVTHTEGFDSLPVFSPDGKKLVWTSNRTPAKQSQLFIAEWDDAEARRTLGLPADGESSLRLASDRGGEAETFEIKTQDVGSHVGTLASDEMEGRLTGTEGARRAGRYVAGVMDSLGLEPAGENGTYFQDFEFTSGVSLGARNRLQMVENGAHRDFDVDRDWRPLAFSKSDVFDPAAVVFAGYGIVAPKTDNHEAYDSFVHLDVEGKWVMVFRYLPDGITPERRQHLSRYSSLRYKAMTVRDRGALGLIVVSGPNSQVKNEVVELTFDVSLAGTSIGALSVTDEVAGSLLRSSGKQLQELQDQLDRGEPMMGFAIPDSEIEVGVDIRQERRTGRNVLARLKSPHPNGEIIAVGAHLDHLGRGLSASSLAREEERDQIHHGADDNASGVGGLLEIARYLAGLRDRGELRMKRDLLVAAWSGEELGRLGSSHFVGAPGNEDQGSSSPIVAYLNLDMIGRLREHVVLQGVGSSPAWLEEIERNNVQVGLPIVTQNDAYLPTDATSFYLDGIPIMSAFTGSHEDYHTPRDSADKINYAGARKIAQLMANITASLLETDAVPQYLEMEKPEESRRANLRAYLGTIPDYSQTDVMGVRLSGVIKGGPAAQAGMQGDDVIVEVAGRKIENIYDYTYAIEALKIGVEVKAVVLRAGQRHELTLTPGSRD